MRRNNPDAYGKELGRRAGRAKRDLLRRGDVDVACFLHPNPRALIDGLVHRGVRTVVLDECHHLLYYWAVVLRHLIGRIRDPQVVGLTATLPSPEDGNEYENYTSLLGDVDIEVPTPAVVKEGDLAPYRDLAYFTKPTQREMDYLNNVQRAFEVEISRFTRSEALRDWAARAVLGEEKDGKRLEEVLNARPVFSVATLRYLRHACRAIPGDLLALPLEANEPPTLEDWAALLERYALDHLQTSPREEDHRELARLRRTLRPFLKIRTAYTLQESLAAVVQKLRVSVVLVLLSFLFGVLLLLGLVGNVSGIVRIPLVLAVAAAFFFNLRSAYRLVKAMLIEYQPDAILRDTGHALLFALQDAGLIGKDVPPGSVRMAEKSGGYEVSLEDASPEYAAVFIRSYRQIFAPVRDQRYLILRNENRLPNRAFRYIWILFRPFFRRFEDYPPAYHPVPDVLATRKENAEAFSRYWQRYVGGGTFVYTRTAEGCCLAPALRYVPKRETWHSKSGSR
jgi:hypothetical protein